MTSNHLDIVLWGNDLDMRIILFLSLYQLHKYHADQEINT